MAIYKLEEKSLKPLLRTTYSDHNILERQGIQRLLRDQIEAISEDAMVIAEEFGEWHVSKRRIDLLCIDKEANLVAVELKLSEDGGYMELQAIRYSAMISTMTFDQVVEAHESYLKSKNFDGDAKQRILEFLDWNEPDEDSFARDVRIVLASADFSKELTSAVLWLNDKGIDIRCVKMKPYSDEKRILVDIQQVIPLPETADFQVEIRIKKNKQRRSKNLSKDYSKFTLKVPDKRFEKLNKRYLMFHLVQGIIKTGVKPDEIADLITQAKKDLFICEDGILNEEEIVKKLK